MKYFFKTVAIVTVFSVCEKALGFLYRIFLSRTIGAEGIGLYQVAISVFSLLFTLCCSGVPITVSRLITKYKAEKDKKSENKIISSGLFICFLFSSLIVVVFFAFPSLFNFLFSDERCKNIFYVMLPGLVFTSIYSVFRGVFWGNKDFLPYSIIELLEEICMIVVGIILISKSHDVYSGAFSTGVAVLVSFILSFSLSTFTFLFRKNKLSNPLTLFSPLIKSSAPITLMRTASSLSNSLVSIILPARLIYCGISESSAYSLFGSAMGQTFPLLFIPSTLTGSFTLVLIPEIAECFYKKNYLRLKNDVEKSLKFTCFISAVFVPVYLVLGKEITITVFDNAVSGEYLSFCAILMIFIGISNLSTSILNSIGYEKKTLFFYLIGGVLMLLSVWFLPKYLGIYSLMVGFGFIFITTSVFNLILINKSCVYKPKYFKFILILFLLMIPTVLFGLILKTVLCRFLSVVLTLIFTGGLTALFYLALVFAFNLKNEIDIKEKLKFLHRKRRFN